MGTEGLVFPLFKKWAGSIAWTLFLWANDISPEDYWQRIAHQEIAMFPEIYRKQIENENLPSITEQECSCSSCGWVGTVLGCEGDVDGDGSLGCPECFEVIEVKDQKWA